MLSSSCHFIYGREVSVGNGDWLRLRLAVPRTSLWCGFSQAIFQSSLFNQLTLRLKDPKLVERLRLSMDSIHDLPEDTRELARAAFQIAIRQAFLFAAFGAAVVFLTALFVSMGSI